MFTSLYILSLLSFLPEKKNFKNSKIDLSLEKDPKLLLVSVKCYILFQDLNHVTHIYCPNISFYLFVCFVGVKHCY